MIKKCLFQCNASGEVRADDRFVCEYHASFLRASLTLTTQDRALCKELLAELIVGRKTLAEDGTLRQVPPKPVPEHIIREDDGSVRVNGYLRWWTDEQLHAHLNGQIRVAPVDPDDAPQGSNGGDF
jgi:hypothetical protein